MISIQVTASAGEVRGFLVNVTGTITERRELNEKLANRLAFELFQHFTAKNRLPNKMNADKTGFWGKVADDTNVESVTDTGATVTVAEERFNIHLFGGTIFPVRAKALTIPLIPEARGLRVEEYQRRTGERLFTILGKRALFERTGAEDSGSLQLGTRGRVRRLNKKSKSIGLVSRTGIRPVFALARKSTIKADPTALPRTEDLITALQDEAEIFMEKINKGGLA